MRRRFAIVIRKNGDKFIATFPVELEEGDQLIIAKEIMSSQVPEEEKWIISGYSVLGPIVSDKFKKRW